MKSHLTYQHTYILACGCGEGAGSNRQHPLTRTFTFRYLLLELGSSATPRFLRENTRQGFQNTRVRKALGSIHILVGPTPAAALKTGAPPHHFQAGIYFPTASIAPQLSIRTAVSTKMRPYLEIPLFLLPAFLLTSEVLLASASATVDTLRINQKRPRSPGSSEKYNLTLCAKHCRTEFFQYCHTRQPGAKGDSNAFRTCMCVYKSGTQYMDHCARHCKGEASFPEQVGELRAWWSNWCGESILIQAFSFHEPLLYL